MLDFQAERFDLQEEAIYLESSAVYRVRIEGRRKSGRMMIITLRVLEVRAYPYDVKKLAHKVGSTLDVRESQGAGIHAGWRLMKLPEARST